MNWGVFFLYSACVCVFLCFYIFANVRRGKVSQAKVVGLDAFLSTYFIYLLEIFSSDEKEENERIR